MAKGFTLIEVITAVFLLTVGVVGVFALINQSLSSISTLQSRLIAAYLAQEGIELVRNIRDSNWLQAPIQWDTNLPSGDCGVDYNTNACNPSMDNNYLKISASGFYNYNNGSATTFKRIIDINKTDLDGGQDDLLEIAVTVTWEERGKTYNFVAKESLYDWR